MRVGIVVPHIFMNRDILPRVIFSPAQLALGLAEGLGNRGAAVTLYTPGPVDTSAQTVTADLSLFAAELERRGYDYVTFLKKHPVTFVGMARQVQAELLARAYADANNDVLDVVHVYTNEEDIGVVFARFCNKPVVFTHHDPFNLLVKYKSLFPKYADLPWISTSYAQRATMPATTHWVGNIYHGVPTSTYTPAVKPVGGYVAFLGRIIEAKGVHVAILAVRAYNKTHPAHPLQLRIAGKHYSGHGKDTYWDTHVAPHIDDVTIIYDGFLDTSAARQAFLAQAEALLVPSLFAEPFGMVCIEALACGTPVIGLDSGALPEIITNPLVGQIVAKRYDAAGALDTRATAQAVAACLAGRASYDRRACRQHFEAHFTLDRMCDEHMAVYRKLMST